MYLEEFVQGGDISLKFTGDIPTGTSLSAKLKKGDTEYEMTDEVVGDSVTFSLANGHTFAAGVYGFIVTWLDSNTRPIEQSVYEIIIRPQQ